MIGGKCAVRAVSLALCALSCACGNGGRDLEPEAPSKPFAALSPKAALPPASPAPASKPVTAASAALGAPLYDLAAHLAMAHVRSGGGLLVDLGTPSRHKYTFGDWRSGWRGDYRDGETTFSYLSGATAKIVFDLAAEEAGAGSIAIRARAAAEQKGRVYLNGRQVGVAQFSNDGFTNVDVPLEDGLRAGRNELLFRFNTKRPVHDGGSASLAVDYVRIGFAGADKGSAAAAYDACLEGGKGEGDAGAGPAALTLAAGESLTWDLPIPDGAVLGGSLSSADGGALVVSARAEDGRRVEVERREGGPAGASFAVDLGAFAKAPAAVSLAAEGGSVRLEGAALFTPSAPAPQRTKLSPARNLIVILIDTVRADHLKPFDDRARVVADQLGRTAAESAVFERAFAQENWTMPSTATVLTGLFPTTHQTKTETNKVPDSVQLASQHLRKLGFATAAFVANGYVSGKFGFERGWDQWTNYVREGKPNRAQFVADDVIAWLERRQKDKRFFLYVHTIDPHVPYMPPREYRALYDDDPYAGPVEATETAKLLEKIKVGALRLNDRDKRRLEALYDGEISYHDDHLARIFSALEGAGLLDDSLIVITSDHGEEFFDHGSVGHGHSMYEELLHVPLIIRLPGAAKGSGRRIDADVGTVDVLPTACEILGVPAPEETEGASLVPLLEGASRDAWPRAAFSEFLDGQRAARMGRFKLIVRGSSTTLFDLAEDPRETRDLSDASPLALAMMRELLGAHLGRFVDTGRVGDRRGSGRKRHASENVTIDRETRSQLEALGYMGR
jgi:choline-sulfatase